MKKYFSKSKLLEFSIEKQFRTLFELAHIIETQKTDIDNIEFQTLTEYHSHLSLSTNEFVQKINKEFAKVQALDYQFQIYIMNLERLLGQSKKEYDFIVKTKDITNKKQNLDKPIFCLLDSVRSAHNVGSFFRNAECFGVSHLYLCGLTPKADHPQVIKTAMNCTDYLSSSYHKSAVETVSNLKEQGHTIWAIETGNTAQSIHTINEYPRNTVLLFGHEQFGLSLELLEIADKIVDINLTGLKNSLNVSVSQAIILNHLSNL